MSELLERLQAILQQPAPRGAVEALGLTEATEARYRRRILRITQGFAVDRSDAGAGVAGVLVLVALGGTLHVRMRSGARWTCFAKRGC